MANLVQLGLGELAEETLGADGIHDLGNILSFQFFVSVAFSDLRLWFEATQEVCHLPTSPVAPT